MNPPVHPQLARAVAAFWKTRAKQTQRQGQSTGRKDQGGRSAVTGGAQCDGFVRLVRELLVQAGLPDAAIHAEEVTLPGYYRATKEWDLLVVADGQLLATLEFKSQIGPSFGNNFNNRTEEALGSATDLWTAYREGAFGQAGKPWLGYFMLLEEAKGSLSPVKTREPHFPVFPEFRDASYARRYEIFCQRLVRERLYDAACLVLSRADEGKKGQYREPCTEISFELFAASLIGRITAYARLRDRGSPEPGCPTS